MDLAKVGGANLHTLDSGAACRNDYSKVEQFSRKLATPSQILARFVPHWSQHRELKVGTNPD